MRIGMFALVAVAAACSDAAAPHSASEQPAVAGGVTTELTTTDTVRFSITIDPWRSTYFYLGAGNSLSFPAGSVCDPATSSYGPTEWDKACSPARYPVTENVRAWLDAQGHPRVDFTPNIRFVPSLVPTGWVTISFADYAASLDPWYNILYCATPTSSCVDEKLTDPSLATVRNPVTGQLTRRIKHFSGYLVGAGDDSTNIGSDGNRIGGRVAFPQASGTPSGTPSEHRSGYILVSGRQ